MAQQQDPKSNSSAVTSPAQARTYAQQNWEQTNPSLAAQDDATARFEKKTGLSVNPNDDGHQRFLNKMGAQFFNQPVPADVADIEVPGVKLEKPTVLDYLGGMYDAFSHNVGSGVWDLYKILPRWAADYQVNYGLGTQLPEEYKQRFPQARDLWDVGVELYPEVLQSVNGDRDKARELVKEEYARKKAEALTKWLMSKTGKFDKTAPAPKDQSSVMADVKAERRKQWVNKGLVTQQELAKLDDYWFKPNEAVDRAYTSLEGRQQRYEERMRQRGTDVSEFWGTEFAEDVGSTVPYIAVLLSPAGATTSVLLSAMNSANQAYVSARENGATFEEAMGAGAIGSIPAVAGTALTNKILFSNKMGQELAKFAGKWNARTGGKYEKIADAMSKTWQRRVGTAGLVEGAQEINERLFVEFGVIAATDKELSDLMALSDELIANGEAGAEVGMFLRGMVELIIRKKARGETGPVTVLGKEVFDKETGELKPLTTLEPDVVEAMAVEGIGQFAGTDVGPMPEGVKPRTLVDIYVDQALNQPEILPQDVPVNELATIIASENNMDIGMATVAARLVRERLDTGKPGAEPIYRDIVTIKRNDSNTWPEDVKTREQAQVAAEQQLKRFETLHAEWLASQGPTPEQEAQRRLDATIGGPQTEKDIEARAQKVKEAAAERERLATQNRSRPVSEALRKEGKRIDQVLEQLEIRQALGLDAEFASLREEMDAMDAALEQGTLADAEAISAAIDLRKQEIRAEIERRAQAVELSEAEAKELQEALVPEAESATRKAEMAKLKAWFEDTSRQAKEPSERQRKFEEELRLVGPQMAAQIEASKKEAARLRDLEDSLDEQAVLLEQRLEAATQRARIQKMGGQTDPSPSPDGNWQTAVDQIRNDLSLTRAKREQTQARRVAAEVKAKETLTALQTARPGIAGLLDQQREEQRQANLLLEAMELADEEAISKGEVATQRDVTRKLRELNKSVSEQRQAQQEDALRRLSLSVDEIRRSPSTYAETQASLLKEKLAAREESSKDLQRQASEKFQNERIAKFKREFIARNPDATERDVERAVREYKAEISSEYARSLSELEESNAQFEHELLLTRMKALEEDSQRRQAEFAKEQQRVFEEQVVTDLLARKPDATQRDIDAELRDFRRSQDRVANDEFKQRIKNKDFKLLLESYKQAEKDAAAEQERLGRLEQEALARTEAEIAARREVFLNGLEALTETASAERAALIKAFKAQIRKDMKHRAGAKPQTEAARTAEEVVEALAVQLRPQMEALRTQRDALRSEENQIAIRLVTLDEQHDRLLQRHTAQVRYGVREGKGSWLADAAEIRKEMDKLKEQSNQLQVNRGNIESKLAELRNRLATMELPEAEAELSTEPEPAPVEPGKKKGVGAAKGKYSLNETEAGVVLASFMPEEFATPQIARRNLLVRTLQVIAQSTSGISLPDLLAQLPPRVSGLNAAQRQAVITESLAAMRERGVIANAGAGQPFSLTLEVAEKINSRARKDTEGAPKGPAGFARPAQPGAGAPQLKPMDQPARVGEVRPGKTAYEYRLNAALESTEVRGIAYAPGVRLEAGAALDETVRMLSEATDEQLRKLIDSDTPAGLQSVEAESVTDERGIVRVTKVKPDVRALPSDTSVAAWVAHRTLANAELRRRAALSARRYDELRFDAAKNKGGKNPMYGRPRTGFDPLRKDLSVPIGMRKGEPILELGDAPDRSGGGLTGTKVNTLDNPPMEPVSKIDLRNAVLSIANVVAAPLLQSNTSGKPYLGLYDPINNMIRLASQFDFHVSLHEVGHAMVARLFGAGAEGPKSLRDAVPPAVESELQAIGKDLYGSTIPEGGYVHEGFAEFFRGHIMRPEAWDAAYPATAAWFRQQIESDSELKAAVEATEDIFEQYRFQGFDMIQAAAQVKSSKLDRRTWKQRVKSILTLGAFELEFLNVASALRQADVEARKVAKSKGAKPPSLSLQDLYEVLSTQTNNLMQTMLSVGMVDSNGVVIPGSASLDMIFEPLRNHKAAKNRDHVTDFSKYLQAKRTVALYESGRAPVSPEGITVAKNTVQELEAVYGETITATHQNFFRWWRGGIDYIRAQDPVIDLAFKRIDEVEAESGTEGTYVVQTRIIYDLATGSSVDPALEDVLGIMRPERVESAGSGRVTKGENVGSSSPARDVLEESQRSMQALITYVHKQQMVRNSVQMAEVYGLRGYVYDASDIEGDLPPPTRSASGKLAEELLDPEDRDVLSAFRLAATSVDVNSPDRVLMDFPDVIEVDGTKKVVRRRLSLERNFALAIASLRPEVVRSAWHGMHHMTFLQKMLSPQTASALVRGSGQVFKLGATSLNITFQLFAAPLMDAGTVFLNGTQPYCGLSMIYTYPYTYLRLAGAEFGLKYEPYEMYKRIGGGFDAPFSSVAGKNSIEYVLMSKGQRIKRMFQPANFTSPNGDMYRLLERKLSFGGRTGRILEMQQALKQSGYKGEGPLSQHQLHAAITRLRRVTANWFLTGRTVGEINRYIPYFSVTFNTFRDMVRNGSYQLQDPAQRIQYGIKMGSLLAATMAYWGMVHDDDDEAMKEAYENASYEDRLRYWIFGYKTEEGTNEVLRIPNPMTEFIPAKLLLSVLDGVNSRDPHYAGNVVRSYINAFMPSLLPPSISSVAEVTSNVNDLNKASVDFVYRAFGWTGPDSAGPLDSPMAKGPGQERVTPYTSQAGVWVSEAMNGAISPRKADQLIEGFLAGAPDTIAMVLGIEGPNVPEAVKQAPGYGSRETQLTVGRFVSRSGPFTMRSPEIQQLSAAYQAALKRKESKKIPETLEHAAELKALQDAWTCVSALNYVSGNASMSRTQRQELQRHATEIAKDVNEKTMLGTAAASYKKYDAQAKRLSKIEKDVRSQIDAQQPGYQPSIDFSKILR